jgi:hypothetical protein
VAAQLLDITRADRAVEVDPDRVRLICVEMGSKLKSLAL